MALSLAALRAAIIAEIGLNDRLKDMTLTKGLFHASDASSLPEVQISLTQVPANMASADAIERRPEVQLHILREATGDIEAEAEADARAAENVLFAALEAMDDVIALEPKGWQLLTGEEGNQRAMRTVVAVAAMFLDPYPAA